MDVFAVLELIGGLALFLFGMQVLGDGLEKQAGGKLKSILEKLTSNPFKGLALGAIVTAIIQSSSATTVMVVGFVNSGIMTLRQAIGIIMGANIGTTITAWILSLAGLEGDSFFISMLKPTSFSPIFAIVGIGMMMFAKKQKKKDIGMILIGFAVLMFGMSMMSSSVEPLADVPEFANVLTLFLNPIFGILAGAIVTGIIQSSSASVGILQALSMTGSITFGAAIPIIMGQNIGTCVTSLLSSIGTTKNARRAAIIHLCFNIIGTMILITVFYTLNAFCDFAFMDQTIGAAGIALVHTFFNLICTFMLFPFVSQLEKLSKVIIKDSKEEEEFELLDKRLLTTPAVGLSQCEKVAGQMADYAQATSIKATTLVRKYDDVLIGEIFEDESKLDKYEDKLGTYLVAVTEKNITEKDSQLAQKLLYTIGEFEQIGDEAFNISESAQEMHEKGIVFSTDAQKQLEITADAVDEVLDITIRAFKNNDIELAREVEPLETVVDYLKEKLKKQHVERLQNGECTIELGFVFSDILSSLEHLADHCSSIAAGIIQLNMNNLDTHAYLDNVKDKDNKEFMDKYKAYRDKYKV